MNAVNVNDVNDLMLIIEVKMDELLGEAKTISSALWFYEAGIYSENRLLREMGIENAEGNEGWYEFYRTKAIASMEAFKILGDILSRFQNSESYECDTENAYNEYP